MTVDPDFAESLAASGDLEWLAGLFGGLAHPLRLRMLWASAECALSAKDLGQRFDVTLAVAAHHVRRLQATGFLELIERRPVRGSVQSLYRLNDAGRSGLALLETVLGAGRVSGETWPLLEREAARVGMSIADYARQGVSGNAPLPEAGGAGAARVW